MTRDTFLHKIAERTGVDINLTTKLVDAYAETIANEVAKGNNVTIQGFGSFEKKQKNDRKFYNPATKDYRVIPGYCTMNFKMSATLKENINK